MPLLGHSSNVVAPGHSKMVLYVMLPCAPPPCNLQPLATPPPPRKTTLGAHVLASVVGPSPNGPQFCHIRYIRPGGVTPVDHESAQISRLDAVAVESPMSPGSPDVTAMASQPQTPAQPTQPTVAANVPRSPRPSCSRNKLHVSLASRNVGNKNKDTTWLPQNLAKWGRLAWGQLGGFLGQCVLKVVHSAQAVQGSPLRNKNK